MVVPTGFVAWILKPGNRVIDFGDDEVQGIASIGVAYGSFRRTVEGVEIVGTLAVLVRVHASSGIHAVFDRCAGVIEHYDAAITSARVVLFVGDRIRNLLAHDRPTRAEHDDVRLTAHGPVASAWFDPASEECRGSP